MSPFYKHLPKVPGFGVETTVDKIGIGLVAGTAALFLLHGAGSWVRDQIIRKRDGTEDKNEDRGEAG
jgi:hydrogenase small subunit